MKTKPFGRFKNFKQMFFCKTEQFEKDRTFSTLFDLMFSEQEMVFAESMQGYRIKETTYGESRKNIVRLADTLEKLFAHVPKDSFIGLSMANSLDWLETFWAILMAGYKPLLVNTRLPLAVLEEVFEGYAVKAVVSDGTVYQSCQTHIRNEIQSSETERAEDSFSFGTEVIFMSSGTQGAVKLCAYTAESFYYQLCDTWRLSKDCPPMFKKYEGKTKQLALLPFYHVFGFMAVYVWFAFFSGVFVFLKDASSKTLLNTVRRHKVTHIFAVPLVWETIYKTTMKTIYAKGNATVKKVEKGLKLSQKGKLGAKLTYKAFGEIREQLFGDSIQFLISGGSVIKRETLEFLNGIGYHMANGYGMTEIGITSLDTSLLAKERNEGSIGKPFGQVKYKCVNGELYVKSNTRAARILQGGKEIITDYNEWFKTNDLATEEKGKYFIGGRKDDLIIGETGENINPNLVENLLQIEGVEEQCLFQAEDGSPTLILYCKNVYSQQAAKHIRESAEMAVKDNGLESEIRKIFMTSTPLMEENDFKISRKKVAKRYAEKAFAVLDGANFEVEATNALQKNLRAIFAEALQKGEEEIGIEDNFFSVLGGSSLDYFTLVSLIEKEMGVKIPVEMAQELSSIRAIEKYLQRSSE